MRETSTHLGLVVPIAEVLDPRLWRERYAFGLVSGAAPSTLAERLSAAQACAKARASCGGRDSVEEERVKAVAAISDDTIRWHLRTALSELELKLGVPMGLQVCKADPVDAGVVLGTHFDRLVQRLPYSVAEAEMWYRIDLPASILSVERIRAFYYGTVAWEVTDPEQIRLSWPRQGLTHIIPRAIDSLSIGANGYGVVWQTLMTQRTAVPDFWAVDYTTGPMTKDGQPGKIEAALAHWCYCVAGMTLLTIGGIGQSKGMTSASVSLDGASKNVSLQSSSIYEKVIELFDKTTERIDWKAIRSNKRGLRLRMFSSR